MFCYRFRKSLLLPCNGTKASVTWSVVFANNIFSFSARFRSRRRQCSRMLFFDLYFTQITKLGRFRFPWFFLLTRQFWASNLMVISYLHLFTSPHHVCKGKIHLGWPLGSLPSHIVWIPLIFVLGAITWSQTDERSLLGWKCLLTVYFPWSCQLMNVFVALSKDIYQGEQIFWK